MCDLKADTVGDYAILLAVLTAAALDSPAGSKMNGVALTYGPILLGGAVALMYALLLALCTSPRRLLTKFPDIQAQRDRCRSMYNILQIISR
jgi:hypothetical protein